jgi:hypothetical protein
MISIITREQRLEVERLKDKVLTVLPEGTDLLLAIVAMSEIVKEFTVLTITILSSRKEK